jgi:Fe-S cluster assembly protein SufD
MTQTLSPLDTYRADILELEAIAPGGPGWLAGLRRRGLEAFADLGFPTASRGNEKWKYTSVVPISRAVLGYAFEPGLAGAGEIRAAAPWDEDEARLVFVDGHYAEELSNPLGSPGLRLDRLSAASSNGAAAPHSLGSLASPGDDAFVALNTAFLRDGVAVEAQADAEATTAMHLVYVSTDREKPSASHPRTLVVAGRNSRLTVLESYVGLGDGSYLTNAVTEIVAEEGSSVEHYRYMAESANAFHVGSSFARLERDSSFRSTSFARGARIARNGLSVVLEAPGASCVLKGLYYTTGSEHIDNHIDVDHAGPGASSDQYFKGILDDSSKAVFSGRVLVRPDAQKTFARQADKNVVLSDRARINTKPSLEIYADDVQCFHGATAGAVADEAIFYMRSRGVDEKTARALFVHGFASEIVDAIELPSLRGHLDRMLSGGFTGAGR